MTTVRDIWLKAVDRADLTNSQFPDDAFMLSRVNEVLSRLYRLIAASGSDWFYAEQSVSVVAGTATYALPTSMMKLLALYEIDSDSRRLRVQRFNRQEAAAYKASPAVSGTLCLCYVPPFTAPTLVDYPIGTAFPDGWVDFAVFAVAAALLEKEQQDASQLNNAANTALAEIMNQVIPRDEAEAEQVVDVSGRWAGEGLNDIAPSRYMYRVQGSYLYIYDSEE